MLHALYDDIKNLCKSGDVNPDFLFFSGDLVQAGANSNDFDVINNIFLSMLEAAGLDATRLFVVPGNHDISRLCVESDPYTENGLKTLLNSQSSLNDALDHWLSNPAAAARIMERLDFYFSFIDRYSINSVTSTRPSVHSFVRSTDRGDVGIACFNTSWRATGSPLDADRKNLLLGERVIDAALNDLADCSLRLAIMHHSLSWLRDFDEIAVEPRLYAGFDAVFFGHVPAPKPEVRIAPNGRALIS